MMRDRFFVVQIGGQYYRTFHGKDLNTGDITTGHIAESRRFSNIEAAEIVRQMIIENFSAVNPQAKHSVTVRVCGLIDKQGAETT